MKINELQTKSRAKTKRLGRGIGSGSGKTSGRGTKGQNSRTGGGVSLGFEGGQTKLSMRLPKVRGFKSKNPANYQIIHTSSLDALKSATINAEVLRQARLINSGAPIKLLHDGAVTTKMKVEVTAASASAITAIEKAGGSVVTTWVRKPAKSVDTADSTKTTQPVKTDKPAASESKAAKPDKAKSTPAAKK